MRCLATLFTSEAVKILQRLQLAICHVLYIHSTAAMKSAGRSSHVSKQSSATAADSFADVALSAGAIFGLPIESTRTANAIAENLVKRFEFVMIEQGLG
jgi:hypothetical protein